MKDFTLIQKAVIARFKKLVNHPTNKLFIAEVDKESLWDCYLGSFPAGTDPIYKVNSEHNCNCCKQFIRAIGSLVSINPDSLEIESLWDTSIPGFYGEVADKMDEFIMSSILNVKIVPFYSDTKNIGKCETISLDKASGTTCTYYHFGVRLDEPSYIRPTDDIPTLTGEFNTRYEMLKRALVEFSVEALDQVIDLIKNSDLYRGPQYLPAVESILKLKKEFTSLPSGKAKLFLLHKANTLPDSISKFRSTAIASLVQDLMDGRDINQAVVSFEAKVSPLNYQRTTAIITPAMVKKLQAELDQSGLMSSLYRRFATLQDLSVNSALFVDRSFSAVSLGGDLFQGIMDTLPKPVPTGAKELPVAQFISDVLPKAISVEVLFESRFTSNLVSLIAPIDPQNKNLFKWSNPFSWSYVGNLTDSIKERVKAAGGKVDGDLRCSLSWFNYDDLDLHMREPSGFEIYYGSKISHKTGGNLDVDMNAGSGKTREAVENICYPNRNQMIKGDYTLVVNQYSKRENIDVGFDVEIEFDSQIHSFHYDKCIRTDADVIVAEINWNGSEFSIKPRLPASSKPSQSKEVWGLSTFQYHKVNAFTLSPNFWDDKGTGNKHFFLFLDKCVNPTEARGFYNEFLHSDLQPHRRALEVVGEKTKVALNENQLSGLGFSESIKNHFYVRVMSSSSNSYVFYKILI